MLLSSVRYIPIKPVIFAPMPKTACNTLVKRLHAAFPSDIISLKSGSGIGHMTIDDRALRRSYRSIITGRTPIIFSHFFPTELNRKKLLHSLHIKEKPKVVVSIRDIYDVAISCADHQRKSKGPWSILDQENSFLDDRKMDEQSHFWNVMVCLKFYASWSLAAQSGLWDVKFITFDQITGDPVSCVKGIAEFFGIGNLRLDQDFEALKENMNEGKKGRGKDLDPYFQDFIRRFADTYKDVDFSPLGLQAPFKPLSSRPSIPDPQE